MSRAAIRRRHHDVGRPAPTGYDAIVLGDNPLAYLPLSGHSSDISTLGASHSGTAFGSPVGTTFPNGDTATVFNGLNQYVEIPDHIELSVVNTGKFCVEFWYRPDVLDFIDTQGTGPYIYMAGKENDGHGQDEWACRMYNLTSYRPNRTSGYVFNLEKPPGATTNLGSGSYDQRPVTAGAWKHYVLNVNTIDTSATYPLGYIELFIDGISRDKDSLLDYNIIPANGTSPVRIGTGDLASFFKGGMAKFAIYSHNLTPAQVYTHFTTIFPAVGGSAGWQAFVGSAETNDVGTKVSFAVGPAGVPAGATLLARSLHAWTSGGPTIADSKGGVWTRDWTSGDGTSTIRYSGFSCPRNVALVEGDIIQLTCSASVAEKGFVVEQYSNLVFTSPFEGNNNSSGTSTTPKTSGYTNIQADAVVYGINAVLGPSSDTYTEDLSYTSRTRLSLSGAFDATMNYADLSVTSSTLRKYQPTLGTSRAWMARDVVYKAGTPVIVPPVTGSATPVGHVGSGNATVAGNTLTVPVGGDGFAAGQTVFVSVGADYTLAAPTCADSVGNVYTLDATSPASGNTMRGTLFRSALSTGLTPGVDTITITFPVSVTRRVATAEAFSRVLIPVVVDTTNTGTNTGTNPSLTLNTTGLHADDLLIAFVVAEGPLEEAFEQDVINQWSPLTRAGTTGAATSTDDRTVSPAWRAVAAAASNLFNPTLGTSTKYVVVGAAYQAG